MSKVTKQGQVRIPERYLHALGIIPGTEVDFEQRGEVLLLRVSKPLKQSRPEDGPRILEYTGPTVTVEEMEAAIRQGALSSQ
jgi:bifunctional DNA-binding transcriptional regulator/antitoxin component of YhaV-PrlF toxin-antitoxin module